MNEIEENMPLLVTPSPDTLIRIIMEEIFPLIFFFYFRIYS